ncbi:restriction endonuclease HphI [Flavobacterium rivuli WB 3.3-2 = DSM 21788]|uniref:Restriction endonuclease HphI n=1 Tax=Flavobacterium rivuli WB 3.3-2 = DSM 21788 TaxID=1121895 RepID=A0A0A2M3C8_9FLAO|nr:HNH endonuclease signature motif containing protein [Flavobacterium rivuli]KGO85978.1 restriction endonuclease HphI [Flavobacterium rivuli WB 3.3-2 = DSM 21788]
MAEQNYEDYWRLTNAFTDYNGASFLSTLRICISFIDEYAHEDYTNEKYNRLQNLLQVELQIGLISVRKAINQLVKLGFINSYLISYNLDSLEYLNARTNRKRKSLLSKIVYSNSSFNRSINRESNLQQLNFLIKTLIENGRLSKSEIIALMLVDIEEVTKGFLNSEELLYYVQEATQIQFITRKYNQVGYLYNLLAKLDDLIFVEDVLYFREDAHQIFGHEIEERRVRDQYLHRLYKNQLQEESIRVLNGTMCMVENLSYPVLIASHIKPFYRSNDYEAYDANNGILLSKNFDSLFDLGYISFNDDGSLIISERLSLDVATAISGYSLGDVFLNEKRIEYLAFHREEVFNKRFRFSA